jgi:hypothetical protein
VWNGLDLSRKGHIAYMVLWCYFAKVLRSKNQCAL